MRRRALGALAAGAILTVLTGMALSGLLFYRPLPTIDGYYRFLGLDERAEVVRDAFGVPRIEAGTLHDLFFLQGYVTAQDRFAQMEAMRSSDAVRSLFLHLSAPLDRSLLTALNAYADGVTKYIDQHAAARALPAEITLSGRRPAAWTTMHTLAVAAVYLASPSDTTCAAIAGDRSHRGRPLLVAELDSAAPAPGWYQLGLDAPGIRAIGVSLPGVPGIVAGHNGSVAWAFHASGRAFDQFQVVRSPVQALGARTIADLAMPAEGAQNGPLAGCLVDLGGGVAGLTPFRALGPDGSVVVGGGAAAEATLTALVDARDLDVEAMRALLGPTAPSAAAARIVIDLGDLDASKAALSTGQSGHRAAFHHGDQAQLWSAGQLHRLAWTSAAVARTEGRLVLRPR
ncbi:MAG: penicillin acylase family protein [Candidatus Limnocylindria bacterium]